MKKNDWIFLVSLSAYTLLLWEQTPGLNFFLMNCILLGGIILRDKTILHDRVWVLTAAASLLSSFCVAWYGNVLSAIANMISLMVTGILTLHKGNSFFGAFALGVINTAASFGYIVVAFIARMNRTGEKAGSLRLRRVMLLLAILVVCFIFFLMYRQSSVLFEAFTDQIDLSFISLQWCVFVAVGAVLVFAYYHPRQFAKLAGWERNLPMNLQPKERTSFFDTILSPDSEYFTGLVLLGLLNVLLLIVNSLDAAFLIGGESVLPEGITYSQYVHQGISMLILSIVFATVIIFFLFRNFHADHASARRLRQLAFLWVAQNMFMVAVSIDRNHSYIHVYGLSYRRIGVDIWLLLALAGLSLVLWKIVRQKTNAFVVKYFGWACFAVLIMSTPVNWDRLIFNYNSSLSRQFDLSYMNSLSWTILPDQHDYIKASNSGADVSSLELADRTYAFLNQHRYLQEQRKFPSWLLGDHAVYRDLIARDKLSPGSQLDISHNDLHTIFFFNGYRHTTWINASGNHLGSLGEIGSFTQLEGLDLRNNPELTSLNGIQQCIHLRGIDVRGTGITSFYPLIYLPELKFLFVNNISEDMKQQLTLINPELQIITGYDNSLHDSLTW